MSDRQFSAEWCVEAAAEIERLRSTDTYHRDTIAKCNGHIQEQEQELERLRAVESQLARLEMLFRELDEELDGVKLPKSAAAVANGIRAVLDEMDDTCDERKSQNER